MESMDDARSEQPTPADAQLAAARQGAVLAHTRYPRLGPWYPPTFGVLAAVFVAAENLDSSTAVIVRCGVATLVAVGAGWYTRLRGVSPRLTDSPAPIRAELRRFYVLYALLVAVIAATLIVVGWVPASLLALVGFTVLIAVHERRYDRAARRAEREAGIVTPAATA